MWTDFKKFRLSRKDALNRCIQGLRVQKGSQPGSEKGSSQQQSQVQSEGLSSDSKLEACLFLVTWPSHQQENQGLSFFPSRNYHFKIGCGQGWWFMSIILITWEAEIGKIVFPRQFWGKKLVRSHLNQYLGLVAGACHHKLCGRLRSRRSWFQARWGKKSLWAFHCNEKNSGHAGTHLSSQQQWEA
jgi:hypothetical protein